MSVAKHDPKSAPSRRSVSLARGGGGRTSASARLRALPRSALLHLYRQGVFSSYDAALLCSILYDHYLPTVIVLLLVFHHPLTLSL